VRGVARITEYDVNANGDVPPVRLIQGKHTELEAPSFVAVDGQGYIYVCDYNVLRPKVHPDILVFAPDANGDAKPVRGIHLSGSIPGVSQRPFITVDSAGYLYVANENNQEIDVYAPGAKGTPTPVRIIRGHKTQIKFLWAVSIDPQGNLVVTGVIGSRFDQPRILVFPPNAHGNVAPIREIRGTNTQMFLPTQVVFDAAGNLYVNDNTDHYGRILVFAPGASGDVAPTRIIYPPKPTFIDGLAILGNELFSAEVYTPKRRIRVYPSDANGITQPLRTIVGPDTELHNPGTIALH
jgi:6-phosphogluconolactonase (cycloisomerase 2 family)